MTHYLQNSGIFGTLAILTAIVVAIAGTLVLLLGKSRRAHLLSVMAAGFPILVGATGSLMGYFATVDGIHQGSVAASASDIQAWHTELASPTVIAATLTLFLIILLGVLFVFRTKQLRKNGSV